MARLHHLAIGAVNVEKTSMFYSEAFALPLLKRHLYEDGSLRSIWLALDEAILMIEHTEFTREQVDGVGSGPFLVAFRVAENERTALEERLVALGSPIEARTAATSYARDPEGNRIAISHY